MKNKFKKYNLIKLIQEKTENLQSDLLKKLNSLSEKFQETKFQVRDFNDALHQTFKREKNH